MSSEKAPGADSTRVLPVTGPAAGPVTADPVTADPVTTEAGVLQEAAQSGVPGPAAGAVTSTDGPPVGGASSPAPTAPPQPSALAPDATAVTGAAVTGAGTPTAEEAPGRSSLWNRLHLRGGSGEASGTPGAAAAPASAGAAGAAPAGAGAATGASAAGASEGAQAGAASSAPKPAKPQGKPAAGGPRRVRLAVSRIDPWAVMKLSFLLSIAAGIALVVATAVVWNVLNSMQVFTLLDGLITDIAGTESFINILEYVEFSRVMSLAVVIAVVDIVIFTAMATLLAFLYNVVAALVGGLHVTLTDE